MGLILLALTALGAVLVVVRLIIGADLSDVVDLAGQPDQPSAGPAACGWRRSAVGSPPPAA